jgi:hypothetical protein
MRGRDSSVKSRRALQRVDQLDGLERTFDSRYGPSMAIARRKPDPDGITRAGIAGTASRHASQKPLDVDAALAELREVAGDRSDLLAERAGVILGFHDEDARDGRWPRRALEAALCIAAGADLTRLMEWIAVGQERAERIR